MKKLRKANDTFAERAAKNPAGSMEEEEVKEARITPAMTSPVQTKSVSWG